MLIEIAGLLMMAMDTYNCYCNHCKLIDLERRRRLYLYDPQDPRYHPEN